METRTLVLRFLCIAAAAGLIARVADAGEIRIVGGRCTSNVHLVAKDASLSDVLDRLSKVLGFQLVDDSNSDAPVTVDVTRRPSDLVASLAGAGNVSMTLEPNPNCPRHERIVKLWVLPGPQGASAKTGQSAAEAQQARREKEGIETVLRAHGIPPPEEPAAKPR